MTDMPRSRVVDRLNELHVGPRVAIVVGPAEADGRVLLQTLFRGPLARNRLRAEGVDAFRAARNERHEAMLVVIDVESRLRRRPSPALVGGAHGQQVVHLGALAAAVVLPSGNMSRKSPPGVMVARVS